MPAHGGTIVLLEYLCWSAVASGFWAVVHEILVRNQWWHAAGESEGPPFSTVVISAACTIAIAFCLTVPIFAWILTLAQHAAKVREHLRSFRMQDTLCSCCAMGHRDQVTGSVIPCDRELVYVKLKEWYGKPGDADGEFLSRFNSLVQTSLADSILQMMSVLLPRSYTFYMIAAANLPWLSHFLARIRFRIDTMAVPSQTELARVELVRDLMQWCLMSMVVLLGCWWDRFIALKLGIRLTRHMSCLSAAALLYPISTLPVIVFLGSFYFLMLMDTSRMFFAIPFSVLLLLFLCYGLKHLVRFRAV